MSRTAGCRYDPAREVGSVTVLSVALIVCGFVLAFLVLKVGGLVAQRAQVSAAADASALAAADELALGHGSASAWQAALETAVANHVELVTCDCSGDNARVEVSMRSRLAGVPPLRARAEARVDFSSA